MSSTPNQVSTDRLNDKASLTAVTVSGAFSRCAHDGKYAHLISENERALGRYFFEKGKNALAFKNYLLYSLVDMSPYSRQRKIVEDATVRGLDELILLRKLMIKNRIDVAIKEGVQQIVFLGGGYDIRGLITAMQNSSIPVYEIDRGKTRSKKIDAISSIPLEISLGEIKTNQTDNGTLIVNKNLFLIECDLGKDNLFQILQKNGYDKTKKTLIIAEGLTMYLTELENQSLLSILAENISDNDQLLLSFITKITNTLRAEEAMKRSNESYKFAIGTESIPSFLSKCGFDVSGKFYTKFMLDKIGADEILEYTKAHPETPEECYFSLIRSHTLSPIPINEVPPIQFEVNKKPVEIDNASPVISNAEAKNTSCFDGINMSILSGFMTGIGATAVAMAFTVLNAATFGLAGIIAASIGTAALLGGLGLFSFSTMNRCRSKNEHDDWTVYSPGLSHNASLG